MRTGDLLFLSGMLPTEGRTVKFVRRVGAELDLNAGRQAARLAVLNGLAVAGEHLGSLDRISRIVRIAVSIATSNDFRDHPKSGRRRRDVPAAQVHIVDGGHFALDSASDEIATLVRGFLASTR